MTADATRPKANRIHVLYGPVGSSKAGRAGAMIRAEPHAWHDLGDLRHASFVKRAVEILRGTGLNVICGINAASEEAARGRLRTLADMAGVSLEGVDVSFELTASPTPREAAGRVTVLKFVLNDGEEDIATLVDTGMSAASFGIAPDSDTETSLAALERWITERKASPHRLARPPEGLVASLERAKRVCAKHADKGFRMVAVWEADA